ncbi:lipopolysaccharide biosynthesis protein [Halomontanus rarus]|uniref:lipopolysaccharide biosynthesis protein n=1 Tax=Halomontanus rarus TaxID=3034020 RepID=UPI0023E7DEB8|nr:oligosaccharide flippase family protein [Halovivax sp. TS33]
MRKISSDILFSGLIRFAIRLRGLVFIPLITVLLGVAEFGAYALILAIANLLELVFGLCLYAALVRYGQTRDDLADLYYSLTTVVIASSSIIAVIIITFSNPISVLTLGSDEFTMAFAVGSLLIITRALVRIARNYYRADSRIKIYSFIEGLNAYGIIISVVVSLYIFDAGLVGLFTAMIIVESLTIILVNLHIMSEIGISIPTFTDLTEHLRYSLPLAASSLASNAASRADRVLIGFFLGAEAIGIYSIVYDISIVIKMYVHPIRSTFFPEFSSMMERGEIDAIKMYTKSGVRFFLIICLPTIAGIGLIGQDIIRLMTQGDTAVPSVELLIVIPLGIALLGFDRIHAIILNAAERTAIQSLIQWVGAIGNLILNVVLIPPFGIVGAGVATVLTYGLTASLTVLKANETVPLSMPWKTVVRSGIATMGMIFVAVMILPDILSIVILGSIIVYFTILFSLKEFTIIEMRGELMS